MRPSLPANSRASSMAASCVSATTQGPFVAFAIRRPSSAAPIARGLAAVTAIQWSTMPASATTMPSTSLSSSIPIIATDGVLPDRCIVAARAVAAAGLCATSSNQSCSRLRSCIRPGKLSRPKAASTVAGASRPSSPSASISASTPAAFCTCISPASDGRANDGNSCPCPCHDQLPSSTAVHV